MVEEHLRSVARDERSFDIHLRGTGHLPPGVAGDLRRPRRRASPTASGSRRRCAAARSTDAVRFNYHPHVTVAHDVAEELLEQGYQALAGFDARFPVWGFSLFEQGPDGTWRPRSDFPFGRELARSAGGSPDSARHRLVSPAQRPGRHRL